MKGTVRLLVCLTTLAARLTLQRKRFGGIYPLIWLKHTLSQNGDGPQGFHARMQGGILYD